MSTPHPRPEADDASEPGMHLQRELLEEAAAQIRADRHARELSRPKNVGQGTLGLFGDSLGGAIMGAAALVMGPVQGFRENGPKGLLSGVVGGLAVGVAAAAVGVGSGLVKFADGAKGTARSMDSSPLPQRLLIAPAPPPDSALYKMEKERLYADLQANYNVASAKASNQGLAEPVDHTLYQVLNVQPDATAAQIRKSYYRLAQKYHPDKHPDDAEATSKFQEISAAYQILSDPVKREEYHRVGADVTADETLMDPKALFALMFSDFEHIVGDLATSTILSSSPATPQSEQADQNEQDEQTQQERLLRLKRAEEARRERKKQFQQLREAHLVSLLNRRLESWMSGDEEEFIRHAKHEVFAMRDEPFGREVLATAAYIYNRRASKVLGKKGALGNVQTFLDDIGDKAHNIRNHVRALEGSFKAISTVANPSENENIDDRARREAVSVLGAVWLGSVLDIESTLKHVVANVLTIDDASPKAFVRRKAEGLAVLGQIFEQA